MGKKNRRVFDKEFKTEALRLATVGDRTVSEVAENPNINVSLLSNVNKWLPLALLLLPLPAHAGDCQFHPVFIHEIEIGKCIVVSEASAGSISTVASPKIVAARYPGLILEGTQTGIRQIDVDGPSEGIKAHSWEKTNQATRFLYQGKSADECKSFPAGKKVKIFSRTTCECDTLPEIDGYCALTVATVTEVPPNFANDRVPRTSMPQRYRGSLK